MIAGQRVRNHSTFSQNRERLFNQDVARLLFERIKSLAAWSTYASDEHFSVDGTLIDAWASHKSFVKKDGGEPPAEGTRNPYADFKGEPRMKRAPIPRPAWRARAMAMPVAWRLWRIS